VPNNRIDVHIFVFRVGWLLRVRWGRLPTAAFWKGDPYSKRQPDWFKSLTKITRQGLEKGKFLQELQKLIHNRMQHDVRMDLREAFCLCLIDEVTGVLKAS
jgi:hypothetical protein